MRLPKDNLFYGLGATLTEEQHDYIYKIFNKDITFCDAVAGAGKTTIAVAAAKYLIDAKIGGLKGLIYIFSPVEEDSMGHRPGDQNEKEDAYLGPLKDALIEIGYQPDRINMPGSWVQAKSHTFLRGTNLDGYVVIIDEAQNYTKKELRKTLTRLHITGKAIVIGHAGQCDLKRPSLSGFVPQLKHFSKDERAGIATLTKDFRGWISQHADAIENIQDSKFDLWLKTLLKKLKKLPRLNLRRLNIPRR